jgi:hypothetical protein
MPLPKRLFAVILTISITGCAANSYVRSRTDIPFKAYPDTGSAAIYLWPPYTSAAIVDAQGNRCVLAASGAQTVDVSSEAALKAGDILGKVANLDAGTKDKFIEAFKQIGQPDSRAAALDIALFHLCVLDQNGTFKDIRSNAQEQSKGKLVMEAYRFAVERALSLPQPAPAAPASR